MIEFLDGDLENAVKTSRDPSLVLIPQVYLFSIASHLLNGMKKSRWKFDRCQLVVEYAARVDVDAILVPLSGAHRCVAMHDDLSPVSSAIQEFFSDAHHIDARSVEVDLIVGSVRQ